MTMHKKSPAKIVQVALLYKEHKSLPKVAELMGLKSVQHAQYWLVRYEEVTGEKIPRNYKLGVRYKQRVPCIIGRAKKPLMI
jgi:hypothetical protein